MKFSSNFTTAAPAAWGCSSGRAYKFIFGGVAPSSSRFGVYNGQGGSDWHAGYPGGEDVFGPHSGDLIGEPLNWDGQWHRYRMHWKVSNSLVSNDGIVKLWIDDRLVLNKTGFVTHGHGGQLTTGIVDIIFGANINQGPGHVQHIRWGPAKVYNQNPGWV